MDHKNILKCPSCGGEISFSVSEESLKCQYCGEKIEIAVDEFHKEEENEIFEHDFDYYVQKFTASSETVSERIIDCTGCGSQIKLNNRDLIEDCAYCGTAITQQFHSEDVLQPQYMLPFKVTRENAREEFKKWQKSIWFAPNSFKNEKAVKRLNGVFMPFFTFDIDVTSTYSGQRGEHYTEHYTDSDGNSHTRTKTRWYSVSGVVYNFFNDVLIYASKTFQRKFVDELEPWDLVNLEVYDADKLRGFDGECYSLDLSTTFIEAENDVSEGIKKSIRRNIGGDEQRVSGYNNRYNDITFKYIILPVWLSNIQYKGTDYRFYINARTGEVQGERPYSIMKIVLFTLMVLAIIGGVYALIVEMR